MREFSVTDDLQKILVKTEKKDKVLYLSVMKKIEEIVCCEDIDHYKNLRAPMQELKRVHVGSFVLVFAYDRQKHKVEFIDFDHHDKIYAH
ncbi:addiction module toxin RelE [Candidatus Woesearchaeota archaeon]|nr:MAG: addiction module toxin RelE [Candidatus Woesearchaeota archaeon]